MATNIKVGDRVRINEKYSKIIGSVMANTVGTEFIVTDTRVGNKPVHHDSSQIISGDPNEWGIWGDFLDVVHEREPKMFTTTTLATREEWINQDRIVSVTSGRGGLSLNVRPNPASIFEASGRTGLTPEQAEELATDLLERVAEIRAGLAEEAGA